MTILSKTCAKCRCDKDPSDFHKDTKRKDGLRCYCKKCAIDLTKQHRLDNLDLEKERNYKAEWRKKNPQLNREIRSRWYYKHRELAKMLSRTWYYNNPLKVYAYHVKKYALNPEVAKANATNWNRANPLKVAAIRHSRRAQKSKSESFTHRQIETMLVNQMNKCVYCCSDLTRYHIDHIVPLKLGGGNNIENIQILCPRCNLRKGAKHPDLFRKLINATS